MLCPASLIRQGVRLIVDTHCHLLPQLDDGPRSIDDAVGFAAALAEHGVRRVLCTPHYSRRYPTNHQTALTVATTLRLRLDAAQIQLGLEVAAEFSPLLALQASEVDLRTRSIGRRFVLVELESRTPVPTVSTVCDRVAACGLLPILAHPERCRGIGQSLEPLDIAREEGALVQVVASSLLGKWGASVADTAWRILGTGRADLLASDAHARRSAAALESASGLVAERLGEPLVRALTSENPSRILQGESPDRG